MTDPFFLDRRCKSYPFTAEPCAAAEIGRKGWNVLAGDLPFPLAVLHRTALEHNLAWMQDYADRKGVSFAPHGKTTMSPELFAQQLAAGAWGLTFATLYQVAIGVEAGARRVVIANQVVCDADFDALALLLRAHADLRVWFLVLRCAARNGRAGTAHRLPHAGTSRRPGAGHRPLAGRAAGRDRMLRRRGGPMRQ
jgi:D-serine dehydratase